MLLTSLALLILQVGPSGALEPISPVPEELRNRPPRPGSPTVIGPAPDAVRQATGREAPSSWFDGCLQQVAEDPARAFSLAEIQRDANAGPERVLAQHCLGLAATELERWADARAAFTAARSEVPTDKSALRARLASMAGNAALAAGDRDGALALFATARDDAAASNSNDLRALIAVDQARTLVGLERLEEALPLLEQARQLRPRDGEVRLLSATLLRRLGRLDEAQAQIEEAANLSGDPQIGVEAGLIAVLSGREDAARKSWQSVIDTRPASVAASSAKAYLDQLGSGPAPAAPQTGDPS